MALTATVRASASEACCDFIQKKAQSVKASRISPTKMIRQIPKPVRIGLSTRRGGRFMTSSSCGSKEITRPSATEVTILTHRTLGDVGRQHEQDRFFDVVVDRAALLYRGRDRGEVIIR